MNTARYSSSREGIEAVRGHVLRVNFTVHLRHHPTARTLRRGHRHRRAQPLPGAVARADRPVGSGRRPPRDQADGSRRSRALTALTAKELRESGSHELLNWRVLLGAVSPALARVRFFGEMGRIDLAALEWDVA